MGNSTQDLLEGLLVALSALYAGNVGFGGADTVTGLFVLELELSGLKSAPTGADAGEADELVGVTGNNGFGGRCKDDGDAAVTIGAINMPLGGIIGPPIMLQHQENTSD